MSYNLTHEGAFANCTITNYGNLAFSGIFNATNASFVNSVGATFTATSRSPSHSTTGSLKFYNYGDIFIQLNTSTTLSTSIEFENNGTVTVGSGYFEEQKDWAY